MKIIIPIGGGEIPSTTIEIDKYIISLVRKDIIKVLFIPTASGDNELYISKFKDYYKSLGCVVDTLLLSQTENDMLIRTKIFGSDIIYIGGGNTGRAIRKFKRYHIDEYLKKAYERGIILTGLSAGAMVYFDSGYSDSNRSTNINNPLSYLKCLNLIPYCLCPHYNEPERKTFDNFVKDNNYKGIALEDNCALVFIDDKIKGIIKANIDAKGYYIDDNKIEIESIS